MISSSLQFVRIQGQIFNLGLVYGFRRSRHERSIVICELGKEPVRLTLGSTGERDRVFEELCDLANLVDLGDSESLE